MRPNKLLYIDTMRGCAILMVIACHQAQAFKNLFWPIWIVTQYTQTGVMLFFVASAFTLCNSAAERANESNRTRNFYIRRFFRIAPLYYVGMAVYVGLNLVRGGTLSGASWAKILANLFFVHSLIPSAFTGVVPGGWSIGTEWLFYAMFPFFLPLNLYLNKRYGLWALMILAISLAGASAAFLTHTGMSNPIYWFWYDFIWHQLPVFMVGIILFLLVQAGRFRPNLSRDVPGFLSFSAIAIWTFQAGLFAALPFASAISFAFLFNIFRITSSSYGIVERVGRASYSMYIFHFLFATFAAEAILKAVPDLMFWPNASLCLSLALTIVLTYLLARVSERLIEHRFIEYGRTLTKAGSSTMNISERRDAC